MGGSKLPTRLPSCVNPRMSGISCTRGGTDTRPRIGHSRGICSSSNSDPISESDIAMSDSQYEECTRLGNSFTHCRMVINSLPNQSTGFSPFYLNFGHEPVTPIQLLKGNESATTESVASFIRRATSDWELARENLERPVGLQKK